MTSAPASFIDKTLGVFQQMLRSTLFHWLYAGLFNLGFWLGFFVHTGVLHQAGRMLAFILALPFALHLLASMIKHIPDAARAYRANVYFYDYQHFRRWGE